VLSGDIITFVPSFVKIGQVIVNVKFSSSTYWQRDDTASLIILHSRNRTSKMSLRRNWVWFLRPYICDSLQI